MKTNISLNVMCIFFAAAFLFSSCGKQADTETMRVYARASAAYSRGRLADVTGLLSGINHFPPAMMLRAKAEYFLGDFTSAEDTCRKAVKLRPSLTEANLYLARILREKGDYSGAQGIIHSMLSDNPQDIRVLRLAAELAADMGKFDEAAVYLDRASEHSAESALALLDRARLFWVSGRAEDALQDLSRARAMLPWETPLLRSISNLENMIMEAR